MSETEVVQRAYCAGSSLSPENNQKKTSEYIVCYVCGGNGANWSLYTKANEKEKSPYFPFLESMEKAKGAKERENGRIDACTVCFSFLLQQWHAYEELCTPVDKRSYWLKRTGTGGIDFNYGNHGSGVEDTARVMKDLENSQKAGEPCQKVMGKDRENYTEPSNDHAEEEQDRVKEGVLKQELQAVVPVKTVNSGTKESEGFMSKNNINDYETFDSCFVCGSRKFKDVMRTVHTKPQLKTETPFYPFLLHHNSLPEAKKIEFMGKVTVCQTCDTILFKQWQNFQKQGIPLSERQYRLPFSLDRLPKQSLKTYTCTIVCFICGEKCPEVSGCDIHTRKGRPGNPYFPFLSRLSPAAGAKPVTAEGLVKTCTDCYNSLLNQWKFFESRDLDERNREYSISNKLATVSKSQTAPDNEVCASDIRCYVCNLFYPDHKIHYIKQPWDKSCVTSSYNGQQIGTIPVCSHCKEDLYKKAKAQNVESNSAEKEEQLNIKQQHKKGMILNNSNLRDHMISNVNHENSIISGQVTVSMDVCFLCGGKFEAATSKQLCVLPRQGVNGCQPFFPSLAYIVPAPSARPLTASGTVVVCCYCHGNMINQWYECGQSDEAGISNPWSRHYFVRRFTCYLCGKTYPRQKITSISAKDYPFLDKLRRPARAFRINCEEDYVVCQHCKEIVYVQKENFDKCGAGIHEREYELPMVIYDSKMCHTYKTLNKSSCSHPSNCCTVLVIGDSESEGDDREIPSMLEQSTNISNDCNSKLVTALGNKQLGSQLQAKESPNQTLPMSSSAAQNSSFAAYLRKLAKQAMSPGSQSPILIPHSNNPTLSPVKSKGCESPKLNGGPSSFKKEISDPSFLTSKENRGHLNLPSAPDLISVSPSMGHQVLPGVFSLGLRGYETKSSPLEELHGQVHMQDLARVRTVPPQPPSHQFYMPFLQRPAMGDSVYMSQFPYYPPPVVEPHGLIPPGFDQETWRKRRAMEHLRQQHERHTHFFSPRDRPLYVMEQDQLKPLSGQMSLQQRSYGGDLQHAREKNLEKTSPRSDSCVVSNVKTANSSIPKETEKDLEVISPKPALSRTETCQTSSSSSCARHSQNNAGTPAVVTSAVSPGPLTLRSSPGDTSHEEREGDLEGGRDLKRREHQIMWTRKMFEQKRRLRQEEIEWQHRQQQMRQQKREVQQELYQFRQKLLQQKESELEDTSKKEQGKQGEREDMDKNLSMNHEGTNESSNERKMMDVDQIPFPEFGYAFHHDQAVAQHPQTMHVSSIYRPPGGQQHELFYPHGYPSQAPRSTRMDTRTYREYLQQPSHFLDNKAVSEWLEKQRHMFVNGEQATLGLPHDNFLAETCRNGVERFEPSGLVSSGNVSKDGEKYNHEPQKLQFLKDLGLMTVSERKERRSAAFGSGKRKLDEDITAIEDERESNKENRVDNEEKNTDVVKSTKGISIEQEKESEAYYKKVDFLSNLGLVTHRKRQELEDDFEKNRWERRTQRFQRRTKRTKKEKKEEKEKNRSRTPLDLDVSGPITRQKQQLLQEYGLILPIKDSQEQESTSSPDSVETTTTNDQKEIDGQGETKNSRKNDWKSSGKNDNEKAFHNSYEVSTPPPRPSRNSNTLDPGPHLTLHSLTHSQSPYRGLPSAFRPPSYHSNLFSINENSTAKDDRTLLEHKSSLLTEELSSEANFVELQPPSSLKGNESCAPVAAANLDMYHDQGSEMASSWLPEYDIPKWPGTKKVVLSYREYNKARENELDISREKGKKLKMDNCYLNEESARLTSTYSGLILSKRELEEDNRVLNGKLEKLHSFLVFVQNS